MFLRPSLTITKILYSFKIRKSYRSRYCMNRTHIGRNGSSNIHQLVLTHSSAKHKHMHPLGPSCAGLFLVHLSSSVELPADFLVQTEVLPFSWNSNADAHEMFLTAVKWSALRGKKKTLFQKRRNNNMLSKVSRHWAPLVFIQGESLL